MYRRPSGQMVIKINSEGMMRKLLWFFVIFSSLVGIGVYLSGLSLVQWNGNFGEKRLPGNASVKPVPLEQVEEECQLDISRVVIDHDEDGDGIKDLEDIIEGARKDAANKPKYKSAYYSGGYPPDNEGVCTDVIWRAFKNAGYDLKAMIDKDIRQNTDQYPRVGGKPDPNIDFRRVPNLIQFFKRHATVLDKEIIPGDVENLQKWQGGDIVVFGPPLNHIAIVSDRRRADGVPLIIHNAGPYTQEADALLFWHENISNIVYHFRWPKAE